jgi:cytidylate kinase
MYRALTLAVLRNGVDVNDEKALIKLAQKVKIDFHEKKTFLDGEDVSTEIRLPKINKIISVISAYAGIRRIMVERQQKLAEKGGVVMDGRDIGTVVLPDAEVKIFLDASLEQRALRRYRELTEKGVKVNLADVKKELVNRDKIDSSRDVAPLKPAKDARIIDTSDMTVEEQVEKVLQIIDRIK